MKIVKHFILTILALSNGLIGIAFLVCAYSPYISPVEHPVGACAGLFFPIFMCLNLAFCFVWLCLKPWGVCLPLLFFAAGWNWWKLRKQATELEDKKAEGIVEDIRRAAQSYMTV